MNFNAFYSVGQKSKCVCVCVCDTQHRHGRVHARTRRASVNLNTQAHVLLCVRVAHIGRCGRLKMCMQYAHKASMHASVSGRLKLCVCLFVSVCVISLNALL